MYQMRHEGHLRGRRLARGPIIGSREMVLERGPSMVGQTTRFGRTTLERGPSIVGGRTVLERGSSIRQREPLTLEEGPSMPAMYHNYWRI